MQINPQQNYADFVKYDIVEYTKGTVLNIGSGPFRLYNHFINIDDMEAWDGNMWKPDLIRDAADLAIFGTKSIDAVFSSYLLQDIKDPEKVLKEWWRVIKDDGYLVLYLPLKTIEFNENTEEGNGCNPNDIMVKMMSVFPHFDCVVNENRTKDDEYGFLQVFQKKLNGGQICSCYEEKTEKTCCIIRYGATGDMLMSSSIFPGLKEQGYHLTLITNEPGMNIVKEDPHIDKIFAQSKFQVPNNELGPYWETVGKKYDKFINLSSSVEGVWLPAPGNVRHRWTQKLRHRYLNENYLEFTHDFAGVPYSPQPMFYPTVKEKRWAEKQRSKIKGLVVLWALAGSAIHKVWPYMDEAIEVLLGLDPTLHIVMVGAEIEQIAEVGWENESRVILKSGRWNVRQSLSFAKLVDIVVGPETGVLNAVSHMAVPKIVFLSHSSENNLTRDWDNCIPLKPVNCDCYPCHKMIYGFDHCVRDDKTGTALCQSRIYVNDFIKAFNKFFDKITQRRAA